jgi:imidazole glycerol-phosphate synthase subunit HisH
MTVIVDSGAGNLRSVQNTLDELEAAYSVSDQAAVIADASKLLLPGVGHFGQMLQSIDRLGIRNSILKVIGAGVPTLGICLGLQSFFDSSEEAPDVPGFGIFPGAVKRFHSGIDTDGKNFRIPHMGWNLLRPTRPSRLLEGLGDHSYAYFANSYYVPVSDFTAAVTDYIHPITSVLEHNNVYGIQCHPEKSGPVGLRIVRNFLNL